MAATDLGRQFLAENSQLLSCWRANVRREVFIDGGDPPPCEQKEQGREVVGGQQDITIQPLMKASKPQPPKIAAITHTNRTKVTSRSKYSDSPKATPAIFRPATGRSSFFRAKENPTRLPQ